MKKIFITGLSLCLGLALVFSCKKKDPKTIMSDNVVAAVLSATPTSVVTDSNKDGVTALTFNWTPANYGFDAAATYVLEIAKDSTEWGSATSKTFDIGAILTSKHTHLDLNNLVLSWGMMEFTQGAIKARVKSDIANTKLASVYSNEIKVKITPYKKATPPAAKKIWVPGDYQSWSPATAPSIESALNNGEYIGIVEMTTTAGTSSKMFKFTDKQDWSGPNYGAGAGADDISATGGDLAVPAEGTWEFTVNTNTLKWTKTLKNWGLIGSSTSDGWNSDQNMKYNDTTKMYKITTDLVVGEIKFRQNDDWGTNFGDDGNNGSLEPGGANIPVAVAGNYTISFDIVAKTYTLVKN